MELSPESREILQPTLLTAHAFRSDIRDSCFELFLPPNSSKQYLSIRVPD